MKIVYNLIQLLGLILCFYFFPFGLIIGLILMLVGGIGYREEKNKLNKQDYRQNNKQDNKINERFDTRKCPFCAEVIKYEALKCKHCGSDLPPLKQKKYRCPKCNELLNKHELSCNNCGVRIDWS